MFGRCSIKRITDPPAYAASTTNPKTRGFDVDIVVLHIERQQVRSAIFEACKLKFFSIAPIEIRVYFHPPAIIESFPAEPGSNSDPAVQEVRTPPLAVSAVGNGVFHRAATVMPTGSINRRIAENTR